MRVRLAPCLSAKYRNRPPTSTQAQISLLKLTLYRLRVLKNGFAERIHSQDALGVPSETDRMNWSATQNSKRGDRLKVFSTLLVGTTVLFFIVFFALGRAFPSHLLWKYSDTIYYPLAALGVVLYAFAPLEISSDEAVLRFEKAIVELEIKEKKAESELSYLFDEAELDLARTWIDLVTPETFSSCHGSQYTTPCAARLALNELIQVNVRAIRSALPDDIDSTARICRTFGETQVAIFNSDGIPSIISRRITPIVIDLQGRKRLLSDQKDLSEFIDRTVAKEVDEWRVSVANSGGDGGEILNIIETATRLQIWLVLANEKCFVLRDADHESMKAIRTSFENQRHEQKSKLDEERQHLELIAKLNFALEYVKDRAWKFILIFAMAIKFGAAIARLRLQV